MPRLPRSFCDESFLVPDNWSGRPCCYLRLSAAYDGALETARKLRWPTESRDLSHMSIYCDPKDVLEAVVGLASQLRG